MNIPTPTTETKTIDGQQVTRTTWTVSNHTLTRIEREGEADDNWITRRTSTDAPHVGESSDCWDDDTAPVTYVVNWSARGDREPEDAYKYGVSIMAAAHAANVFAAIRAEHN